MLKEVGSKTQKKRLKAVINGYPTFQIYSALLVFGFVWIPLSNKSI